MSATNVKREIFPFTLRNEIHRRFCWDFDFAQKKFLCRIQLFGGFVDI